MRATSSTPYILPLAVIAGVFCLASTATVNDQYGEGNRGVIRNTRRVDDNYGPAWTSGEADVSAISLKDDDVKVLVIPDDWNFAGSSVSSESQGKAGLYEIVFAANTGKKPNDLVTYEIDKEVHSKSDSLKNDESLARWQIDNLRKRSSAGKSNSEKKEEVNASENTMSLQELLKHWGIDTSVRGQRGDIEVTEAPRDYTGRGDVPAAFIHTRNKRQTATGRKLLWRPDDDVWGYGENDGYQADQAHGDDYADEEERRYLKGNGHHRKHHHGHDNEIRRQQEEERRRQEEEEVERRRQEEERRRQEEERRRQDEERRRLEIERRRQEDERRRRPETKGEVAARGREPDDRMTPIPITRPEEHMTYEERLRQWQKMKEEYDKQARERHSGHNRNRTKTPEELENERKLQDYIRRNTPIDVTGRRGHHNRTQPPTAANQRRPDDHEDRRYQTSPAPTRNNEYEEQLRRREEEERRRQQQQQQEEEHRRRLQEEDERRRYQQEEEERRRKEEEEEKLRREQPPRPTDEEQRIRENEAIRQAEHRKRLEQENHRRLIEEQSRRYEEQQRKAYESRTRGPIEQENPADQDRRRNEGVKRPYQPIKTDNRKGYDEASRATTETPEAYRDPNSRKRPTDVPRKMWWTERTTTPNTETARPDNERREWPTRPAEESTGYPDRRRPDQKGWQEEENRKKYQELKKNSDTVFRHGGRPALSHTNIPAGVTTTPVNTRRREETVNIKDKDDEDNDDDEEERLRRLESVPVASRITPRPTPSSNDTQPKTPPQLTSRLGGSGGIDFPGFSPNRRGPEAARFPAPATQRPAAKSPKPCVWAIVVCCRDSRGFERQSRCFEAIDCLSWDESRCQADNVRAANRQLMNFYISSRASFL